MDKRIGFLDGLRGIAAVGVALWHVYGSTYAPYLPYGARFNVIPISVAWVGVQLFFIISGFVILMTLERCDSFVQFGWRRWLRLFPAMFVCSIIILLFDIVTSLGPYHERGFINLIPGLTFLSPSIINSIFHVMIPSMDGSYWTLYVEVYFYITFGVAYFMFGERGAIVAILTIFAITTLANFVVNEADYPSIIVRVTKALNWMGFCFYGWFSAGALFFVFFVRKNWAAFFTALLVAGLSVFAEGIKYGAVERVALLSIVILFAGALIWRPLQRILSSKFILFFGFISYPLYLVHSNIEVGLTGWLGQTFPTVPHILLPVVPLTVVILVAWMIAKCVEAPLKSLLKKYIPMCQALWNGRRGPDSHAAILKSAPSVRDTRRT